MTLKNHDFFDLQSAHSSVIALRRSSKAHPKAKLAPKKGHRHCLVVCCQSDPLQLSESQWNHYIWEVCSANRWDAPKTAMPTAGIGQQNGPNSSPKENLSTYETTNTSEVVLQSFASSAIFMWPLTKQLPLLQVSWQLCRENISKTNRRQKMLSKSSSNPKALIFML